MALTAFCPEELKSRNQLQDKFYVINFIFLHNSTPANETAIVTNFFA